MSAFLKKLRHTANDFRPKARPKVVPVIFAAGQPSTILWATMIGVCLLVLILSGAVMWMIHESGAPTKTEVASIPAVPVNSKVHVEVQPETKTPPANVSAEADIVLPAETLAPDVPAPGNNSNSTTAISFQPELGALSPDELLQNAHAALEAQDRETALSLYDRVLSIDDNNHAALAGRMYVLQRLGHYEEAVRTGRHLTELAPDDASARVNFITALSQSALPESAVALQHIAAANPRDAQAQAALAQMLARQGKLAEAFTHLNLAAKLAPNNIIYKLDLAILYDRGGYAAAAADAYQQVLRAASNVDEPSRLPFSATSIRERADYLAAGGKNEEANALP